jgi:parvulin-like peptidyl-prolyl isomerase
MNLRQRSFHSILFWRACILLGLLLACSATSCQAADPGAKASTAGVSSAGGSPAAAAKTAGTQSGKVVVLVNGDPIYEEDLSAGLPQDAFQETLDTAKDLKLERLTETLMMQQFLKSQNIEVAQRDVDEDIANLKKNPPSAGCPCCRYESLDQYMKLNYITPAELTQMSRNQIGFQKYLDAQWQKTYPTPEDRASLLKEKRSDLEKKYAKAYHIFFNAAQDPDYKRDADAILKKKQALADEAWKRLQRGETFEAVAKAMSEDKMSAAEGGFLGYVSRGAFGKEFSDALFQMKPGTCGRPLASPWGWHIIRREPLSDEDLLGILKDDYLGDKAQETIDAIDRTAKIERPGAAPVSAAPGK